MKSLNADCRQLLFRQNSKVAMSNERKTISHLTRDLKLKVNMVAGTTKIEKSISWDLKKKRGENRKKLNKYFNLDMVNQKIGRE